MVAVGLGAGVSDGREIKAVRRGVICGQGAIYDHPVGGHLLLSEGRPALLLALTTVCFPSSTHPARGCRIWLICIKMVQGPVQFWSLTLRDFLVF